MRVPGRIAPMDRRLVAIAVLCLAGLPAAAGGADLKRGLILHYPLDKDASDASGEGHHGENHGATPVAKGRLGGAFSFDGKDDHVRMPVKATEGLVRFTIALWVRTTQAEAQPRGSFWQNRTLVGAATGGYASRDLGLMLENGCVAYFHGLYLGSTDMSWFSAVSVSDDQWHHLALVCDGPRVRVYVDGRLARGEGSARSSSVTPLGMLTQTASGQGLGGTSLFLGASADAHASPTAKFHFRGFLDDVRLWKRALHPTEVGALARGDPAR